MQNGITLIALIITIIVLLILAGVSLSLIVGQNGVLNKATDSVVATKKGTAVEQVSLAWSACQTDYLTRSGEEEKSTFFTKEKLNENLGQGEVISVNFEKDANGSEVVYKLENSTYTIQIANDGEVNVKGEEIGGNPPTENPDTPQEGIGAEDIASSTTCPEVMQNEVVVDYLEYTKSSDGTTKSTDWQVLYADSNNIYLIMKYATKNPAGDITLSAGVGSSAGYATGSTMLTNAETKDRFPAVKAGWFSKWMDKYQTDNTWTSNLSNMQATLYMLDSSDVWNTYVFGPTGQNTYANWAIGGPTMEMFTKSYDKIQGTNKYEELAVEEGSECKGYNYGGLNSNDYDSVLPGVLHSSREFYWLSAPSSYGELHALRKVDSGEGVNACIVPFVPDSGRFSLCCLSEGWSQVSGKYDNRTL